MTKISKKIRRIEKLSMSLFIIFFMIFSVCNFDNKTYAQGVSSNYISTVYSEDMSDITLLDEEVEIFVKEGKCVCKYEINNDSEKKKKFKFIMPLSRDDETSTAMDVKSKTKNGDFVLSENESHAQGFMSVYLDDKEVDVKIEKSNLGKKDYIYTFEVELEAKKTYKLVISYDIFWKMEDDYTVMLNVKRSQNILFKNNVIDHTKITFDFSDLLNYYVIVPNDHSIYSKVSNKYIWEARNYSPVEDISLVMKPKLLKSKKLDTSYYKENLEGKKILIDIDNNYTKEEIEKEVTNNAAFMLKQILEESKAEVAISTNIKDFEKKIKKKAEFDYIVTLILTSSSNLDDKCRRVFIEPMEDKNEEKYVKSKNIQNNILSCDVTGISTIFTNLTYSNLIIPNIASSGEDILIKKSIYNKVPRVIVSLGNVQDKTKMYNEYEALLEKVRLGLVINNEIEKNESQKLNNTVKVKYKKTYSGDNVFLEKIDSIKKFFRYNIVTIIICIIAGTAMGVIGFVVVINKYEKKVKEQIDEEENKRLQKKKANKEKLDIIRANKEANIFASKADKVKIKDKKE